VVDADGQSWEIENLFVSDASTFPTSSGSNPMVTTLAISHMIAQGIKDKLLAEIGEPAVMVHTAEARSRL
jgi:choline dehydrogenase-like flavoprotein